jgi:histidinol-phosphate phosphatase family protein
VGRPALIPPAAPGAPWDIVFLDRDGTLNVRVDGYVDDPERLELLPGAATAVAALNRAGCRVVLVTNQRGLATRRLTWSQWTSVTAHLGELLAVAGGHLDRIEMCPHDHGSCDCRKPGTGMFRSALAAAPWADRERCAMVGDMPSDIAPARELGMHAVMLGVDAASLADAVDGLLSAGDGQ